MKQLLTLLLALVALQTQAKVVKDKVPSDKMGRSIPCVIVLPDNYDPQAAYPAIYLLHGFGGNQNTWIAVKPSLNDIVPHATASSLFVPMAKAVGTGTAPPNPNRNSRHSSRTNSPATSTRTTPPGPTEADVPSRDSAWAATAGCGSRCATPTFSAPEVASAAE